MKYLLLPLLIFSFGCNEDRLRRKIIDGKNCEVEWFYYSYISNTSPDIVTIKSGSKEIEVYRASGVIVNVYLADDTALVIRTFRPSRGVIYTNRLKPNAFGYKIILDTTAVSGEIGKIPIGVK